MSRRRARNEVVLIDDVYVAPRVAAGVADGRAVRRARCGHLVLVGRRGLDAIGRRGKELICGRCYRALALEHGAALAIWSIEDAGAAPRLYPPRDERGEDEPWEAPAP